MQPTLLFILAAFLVVFAQVQISVFDYKQVATCARSCKILIISELNCIPPAARISNNATYLDCFCQSEYLKPLHGSGVICHHVCNYEDDLTIYHYYKALCGSPQPSLSSSSSCSSTKRPPVETSMSSARGNGPTPSIPSPSANIQDKQKDHCPWIHENKKYFIITGFLIVATFALIFSFALLYSHRRGKSNIERSNTYNNPIPLQPLSSSAERPRTPASRGNESIENLPSSIPASPLAPPGSAHTFMASLQFYAEEIREREERRTRTLPRDNGPLDRT